MSELKPMTVCPQCGSTNVISEPLYYARGHCETCLHCGYEVDVIDHSIDRWGIYMILAASITILVIMAMLY